MIKTAWNAGVKEPFQLIIANLVQNCGRDHFLSYTYSLIMLNIHVYIFGEDKYYQCFSK